MLSALRSRVNENPWPYAIFATAFLVRLIYIIEKSINDPSFALPMVDELWHWRWAHEIAYRDFWGDSAYFRAPLYPYFLALLVKLTSFLTVPGEPPFAQLFAVRTIQALVAAGTAVMVYKLANENFSRKIGIVAGFGYALYGTLVFYETMLLIPVLFQFLLVAGTLYLTRWVKTRELNKLIASGFIYGLAAISRPNILLVVALLSVFIYFSWQGIDARRMKPAYRFKRALFFLLAILIPVFAVTLRNMIVTGDATLISTQGGVNLYLGNNRQADGLTMLLPEVALDQSVSWSQFGVVTKRIAERESGRSLSAAEESSFWSRKAMRYITTHPGDFLGLTAKKALYLSLGFENSDNSDIYFNRKHSILMSALLWSAPIKFPYGLLFPLALIGMFATWSRRRDIAPFYIFALGYMPTIFLFLVTARHRLPLVPFLLIFATLGAIFLFNKFKRRENLASAKTMIVGGSFVLVLVAFNINYFDIGFQNTAQIYHNQGITYERRGDWKEAEMAYRQAVKEDSLAYVSWNALAFSLQSQGRTEAAGFAYERSLAIRPDYIEASLNFGRMLESLGFSDRALSRYEGAAAQRPNDFRPHINIGNVHMRRREYDLAEISLKTAKRLAPENKEVYFKLGELYGRLGKFFEAEKSFKRGAYLGEPGAIAYLN
ncbi:MAG: tetratricopeptide repeat protein, partial [candidate division Zixibacteria bacterium]|nr:tetratricopeptide repeat protein [candidate division Zixibacteria bacterium]